ncbi:MAG: AAA family ATPase [Rickettsiales bacterium]|jgi:ATP-dependent DNA helicase PIF1|nr:AAA family ATPase [Rickettsiales bacterium]
MYSYLSESQKLAIDTIVAGNSVFIGGAAGTGKSYLLKHLKTLKDKNVQITATTGIAAINVGGVTLHSWASLGVEKIPVMEIARKILSPRGIKTREKILATDILAIDEVSMLSQETFEMLSTLLEAVRGNEKPFGGIQLVLMGDFFQLPPVNSSRYCFESPLWSKAKIETVILKEIFRQLDKDFIELLNNIRYGIIRKSDISLLKSRFNIPHSGPMWPTVLTTHNMPAEIINLEKLNFLSGQERIYKAKYTGDTDKIDIFRKNSLAKDTLILKIGSQVMMLKNSYQSKGIINGSTGIIVGFSEKKCYPVVNFENGQQLTIIPETWEISSFNVNTGEIEVLATMTQIPLILAWAITVHKSQGMTIDKIECDLKNSFSEGQIYVALSRARNLEGLFIKSFDVNLVKTNEKVINFYSQHHI